MTNPESNASAARSIAYLEESLVRLHIADAIYIQPLTLPYVDPTSNI